MTNRPQPRTKSRLERGVALLGIALLIAATAGVASAPSPANGTAAADQPPPGLAGSIVADTAEPFNPIAPVLVGLLVMLAAGKLAARGAERLGQPAVLGELVAGIALGGIALSGWHGLGFLATDPGLRVLAELGAIILLFEVGLESDLAEMRAVGWSSLAVAFVGVLAPFVLGWGVAAWMLPTQPTLVHVFVGAILCATSVGITARVLADLGRLQDRESKIVLGAAVLDDILGLVILAVVTGAIQAANHGASLDAVSIAAIMGQALAFLLGAVALGGWVSKRLLRLAARLEVQGMLLVSSFGFCLLLAWLANLVGLATIVGAFAAGLLLDEVHYHDVRQKAERPLAEVLRPIAMLLVPIFFVRMGVEVDLRVFCRFETLGLAALLTLAAVAGKLACGLGILERGLDRLSVAVAMIPRGEVGLIFAGIGAQLFLHGTRVVKPHVFSAVVITVIATTVLGPPLLKLALRRRANSIIGRILVADEKVRVCRNGDGQD
jgi:Kef-type K+ transport system membrane component KefB